MKKAVIRNIIYLSIVGSFCVTVIALMLIPKTRGWFMQNDHISNNSELIYAINQGYGDDLISLNNMSRIYQTSDETVTEVMFVPGDQIYYTFVFRIKLEDYVVAKNRYNVSLVIRAEASENAVADVSGDYLSFLHNCTIRQNSLLFSVLYRGVETIDGNDSVYYDYIKYNNEGGNYTIDPDGEIVTFNSTTIGAETLNSSVPSFCPNETVESIGADFSIQIPILPISQDIIYEEDDESYLFFMLFVPILYIDTDEVQNIEMDSTLTINGSTILLID